MYLSPTAEETDPVGRKWRTSFHEDLCEQRCFVDQEWGRGERPSPTCLKPAQLWPLEHSRGQCRSSTWAPSPSPALSGGAGTRQGQRGGSTNQRGSAEMMLRQPSWSWTHIRPLPWDPPEVTADALQGPSSWGARVRARKTHPVVVDVNASALTGEWGSGKLRLHRIFFFFHGWEKNFIYTAYI